MRATVQQASAEYLRVRALPERELERLMLRGETPDETAMAGWEYRGANSPAWAKYAGIAKFIKGFWRDGQARVWGFNIPVVQNGYQQPWEYAPPSLIDKLRGARVTGEPKRFGFYRALRVEPEAKDNSYLHALLLDYGQGQNPPLDPSAGLRDYVVRVDKGSDDLLLGKAYFAAGPLRVNVHSYFVLERLRPSTWVR